MSNGAQVYVREMDDVLSPCYFRKDMEILPIQHQVYGS